MADEKERKERRLAQPRRAEAGTAARGEAEFNPPPNVNVTLQRAGIVETPDQALWVTIRKSTEALSFESYERFMDDVMCNKNLEEVTRPNNETTAEKNARVDRINYIQNRRFLPYADVDAYRRLKVATEIFMMVNCGVFLSPDKFVPYVAAEESIRFGRPVVAGSIEDLWRSYLVSVNGSTTIPYLALIRRNLKDQRIRPSITDDGEEAEQCLGILEDKLTHPCFLELIWSYWHEEGMLVQTLNAINLRFQNRRGPKEPDPLANLELDPLRPLNNLLWGYIQDEQHRLTMTRRSYEYDHHYGIRLEGRAVPSLRPADSRSKFIEAFHNLLHLCWTFYKEDDDTTVAADAFPVLNALKEVHVLLSQGAHNQFGDLPWTARQEMLMEQWLLARPEMREFLPSRIMVDYPETWMHRVEAMKKLQGWTDTSIIHFRNLGMFGERVLLSIRFGAWSNINDQANAANWARYWRSEVQNYLHSYRAVTGVDLTTEATETRLAGDAYLPPSVHLQRRLSAQQRSASPARGVAQPVK